jgi:predicted DNA-binding transcriptional regulator AlpA
MEPIPSETRYLGIAEVERRYQKQRSTIFRWTKAGRFPPPVYLGNRRAWPLMALLAWEASLRKEGGQQ